MYKSLFWVKPTKKPCSITQQQQQLQQQQQQLYLPLHLTEIKLT